MGERGRAAQAEEVRKKEPHDGSPQPRSERPTRAGSPIRPIRAGPDLGVMGVPWARSGIGWR